MGATAMTTFLEHCQGTARLPRVTVISYEHEYDGREDRYRNHQVHTYTQPQLQKLPDLLARQRYQANKDGWGWIAQYLYDGAEYATDLVNEYCEEDEARLHSFQVSFDLAVANAYADYTIQQRDRARVQQEERAKAQRRQDYERLRAEFEPETPR